MKTVAVWTPPCSTRVIVPCSCCTAFAAITELAGCSDIIRVTANSPFTVAKPSTAKSTAPASCMFPAASNLAAKLPSSDRPSTPVKFASPLISPDLEPSAAMYNVPSPLISCALAPFASSSTKASAAEIVHTCSP